MAGTHNQWAQVWTYAIGLGSNRPLRRGMGPRAIVEAALDALHVPPLQRIAASPIIASRPIGPSRRTYANAVAIVETALMPLALLDHLQAIETRFGRRRAIRWGARTLDLDILLWSGGLFVHPRLAVPHRSMLERAFVLRPLAAIAADWRHPLAGVSIAALVHRHGSTRPIDR